MLARQNFFRNIVNEYLKAGTPYRSRYESVRKMLVGFGAPNVADVPPEREIEFLKKALIDDPEGWMDALADALGVPVKSRTSAPAEGDEDEDGSEDLPDEWNALVGTMMSLHQAGFNRMHVFMDDELDFVVAVSCA